MGLESQIPGFGGEIEARDVDSSPWRESSWPPRKMIKGEMSPHFESSLSLIEETKKVISNTGAESDRRCASPGEVSFGKKGPKHTNEKLAFFFDHVCTPSSFLN